jgi:hypothetical protein
VHDSAARDAGSMSVCKSRRPSKVSGLTDSIGAAILKDAESVSTTP